MKSKSIVPRLAIPALSVLSLVLAGCAATQVALEHKDLNVQSEMSATVFLDVESPVEKTVFVDVRNTSDKDFDVAPLIKARLEQKGYAIVASAQQASYVVQANVLQVGMANPSALHDSLYAGWGGPLAGGVAGALVGGNRTSNSFAGAMNGAGIGGLLGGAGELIAGSLVKDVTYSMITERPDYGADQCGGCADRAVQSPAGHRHPRRPIQRKHKQLEKIPDADRIHR